MYLRALRTVFNFSTKLTNKQKVCKNTSLTFCAMTSAVQKLAPNCYSIGRNFCSVIPPNEKDGALRKNMIDQRAQATLDSMLAENPEIEKFIKILELEMSVLRQNGENVPSTIAPRHWVELVQLKSISKRMKFYDYLFKIEKQKEKKKLSQIERHQSLEVAREERKNKVIDPNEIIYGIGQNSFFRRLSDTTMNQLWNWNCLKSIMYGNKIVFDCSYESYMKPREIKSCAKQIMESFAVNRTHNYPFHIYLCNVDLSGPLIENLTRFIPTLFDSDFPITVTTESYLEIFGKNSIVYLTSNTHTVLETYESESIYIIGAYVDRGCSQPISMGKAKKENLRMAKLPIDKYIRFGDGSGKDLTLNQVMGVMLDAQTDDWEKAMLNVPRRKTYEARAQSLQKKLEKDIEFRMKTMGKDHVGENNFSKLFQSNEVHDYSHAARAKLREQWNK